MHVHFADVALVAGPIIKSTKMSEQTRGQHGSTVVQKNLRRTLCVSATYVHILSSRGGTTTSTN